MSHFGPYRPLYAFVVIFLFLMIGCHGKPTKGSPGKHAKPWADADTTAQLEADTTSMETTDTLALRDSTQQADSLLASRDTIATSRGPIPGNQYLEGHAGRHALTLGFSTISGNDLLGNATIDGQRREITGRYTSDDRTQLVIDEATRERDATPFHIELHAVKDGYEGTFTAGQERVAISLARQ